MKTCTNCGNELRDDALLCSRCGTMVPAGPTDYSTAIEGAATTNLISCVLLVAGIGIWLFASMLIGVVLALAAEIVALLPNTRLNKLFKTTGISKNKAEKKAIQKELKKKSRAYAFSMVLGVISLICVIVFALLL